MNRFLNGMRVDPAGAISIQLVDDVLDRVGRPSVMVGNVKAKRSLPQAWGYDLAGTRSYLRWAGLSTRHQARIQPTSRAASTRYILEIRRVGT
jgi:hypothetical protein